MTTFPADNKVVGQSGHTTDHNLITDYMANGPVVNVRAPEYAATGNGVTDDTAAIQAAITAATGTTLEARDVYGSSKTVYLPPGVYAISDQLFIPEWVDLVGAGTGNTAVLCTTADAQIAFGEAVGGSGSRGGSSGNFTIDGDTVATNPLFIGLCVERTFENIMVYEGAGENILVQGAQNCPFIGIKTYRAGTSGITLDLGVGGCVFLNLESRLHGETCLKLTQSGAQLSGAGASPDNLWFFGGILEDPDVGADSVLYLGAGLNIYFNSMAIIHGPSNDGLSMKVIKHRVDNVAADSTQYIFRDCVFQGDLTSATLLDLRPNAAYDIYFYGRNKFLNVFKLFVVDDSIGNIHYDGMANENNVTTFFTALGTKVRDNIVRNIQTSVATQLTRTGTTDPQLFSYITGETDNRWRLRADGVQDWGGGAAALDTTLYRPAANTLATGVDDCFRTGYSAHGSLPSAAAFTAGSQFYCTTHKQPLWSDATNWVEADGTNH